MKSHNHFARSEVKKSYFVSKSCNSEEKRGAKNLQKTSSTVVCCITYCWCGAGIKNLTHFSSTNFSHHTWRGILNAATTTTVWENIFHIYQASHSTSVDGSGSGEFAWWDLCKHAKKGKREELIEGGGRKVKKQLFITINKQGGKKKKKKKTAVCWL